jgi:hypothetical protein
MVFWVCFRYQKACELRNIEDSKAIDMAPGNIDIVRFTLRSTTAKEGGCVAFFRGQLELGWLAFLISRRLSCAPFAHFAAWSDGGMNPWVGGIYLRVK